MHSVMAFLLEDLVSKHRKGSASCDHCATHCILVKTIAQTVALWSIIFKQASEEEHLFPDLPTAVQEDDHARVALY